MAPLVAVAAALAPGRAGVQATRELGRMARDHRDRVRVRRVPFFVCLCWLRPIWLGTRIRRVFDRPPLPPGIGAKSDTVVK
jgi:hypothetical protein